MPSAGLLDHSDLRAPLGLVIVFEIEIDSPNASKILICR